MILYLLVKSTIFVFSALISRPVLRAHSEISCNVLFVIELSIDRHLPVTIMATSSAYAMSLEALP